MAVPGDAGGFPCLRDFQFVSEIPQFFRRSIEDDVMNASSRQTNHQRSGLPLVFETAFDRGKLLLSLPFVFHFRFPGFIGVCSLGWSQYLSMSPRFFSLLLLHSKCSGPGVTHLE